MSLILTASTLAPTVMYDSLILEGSEAGGHIGPVSINVLVQEILPKIMEVPVFVAGGIGRGEIFLKYLELGAAGCQIGTRLVCSDESIAHKNFKEIFIKSEARNCQISVRLDKRFPVIPVRAIENKASEKLTNTPLPIKYDMLNGQPLEDWNPLHLSLIHI